MYFIYEKTPIKSFLLHLLPLVRLKLCWRHFQKLRNLFWQNRQTSAFKTIKTTTKEKRGIRESTKDFRYIWNWCRCLSVDETSWSKFLVPQLWLFKKIFRTCITNPPFCTAINNSSATADAITEQTDLIGLPPRRRHHKVCFLTGVCFSSSCSGRRKSITGRINLTNVCHLFSEAHSLHTLQKCCCWSWTKVSTGMVQEDAKCSSLKGHQWVRSQNLAEL